METNGLFNGNIPLLERALDLRSGRHQLLASNIANLDTPGYKAFDIMVEEELQKTRGQSAGDSLAMTRTSAGHQFGGHAPENGARAKFAAPQLYSLRGDGNTVDLDQTVTNLTKNNLMYHVSSEIIRGKFTKLLSVIKGGK
ncbi:MAG: flagellar basal body rod protein FlgB [Desulfobacterales bacterium]|nr:flagellar basal body rod protein FlgB [Desulfobacterales bacterium]